MGSYIIEKESNKLFKLNSLLFKELSENTIFQASGLTADLLLFVLSGTLMYNAENPDESITIKHKFILIPRLTSFSIEAINNCEIITYAFYDYMPFNQRLFESAHTKSSKAAIIRLLEIKPALHEFLDPIRHTAVSGSYNAVTNLIKCSELVKIMERSYTATMLASFLSPIIDDKFLIIDVYMRKLKSKKVKSLPRAKLKIDY